APTRVPTREGTQCGRLVPSPSPGRMAELRRTGRGAAPAVAGPARNRARRAGETGLGTPGVRRAPRCAANPTTVGTVAPYLGNPQGQNGSWTGGGACAVAGTRHTRL